MRVIYHNWSAMKQRRHPQSVAEISHHSVLSFYWQHLTYATLHLSPNPTLLYKQCLINLITGRTAHSQLCKHFIYPDINKWFIHPTEATLFGWLRSTAANFPCPVLHL